MPITHPHIAVSRGKILQNNNPENFLINKNVYDKPKKNLVSENEQTYIDGVLNGIENENLRLKLNLLGQAVFNNKK